MRNSIYNHPDLKYIIRLLKQNMPHTEIAERVNKRAKGEPVSRFSIGRFAKNYADTLKKNTSAVIKKINEVKQEEIATVIEAEVYIEEQIIPATDQLDMLFSNGLAFAQTVLEDIKVKERDMRDLKTLIDSLHSLNELKKELNDNLPGALIDANDYERYMAEIEVECEEGEL